MKEINNGVYPTMITPFTDDNKIDYNGVKELLKWYERKGVDGIFAICQSSEIFFLSFEERLELLKFIMANKPEGMSIVASGHTSDDLDVQIEEAKAFIVENGYDPVYGARPLKRYLQKHVETLAAKLILSDGVRVGDTILIEAADGKLSARAVR